MIEREPIRAVTSSDVEAGQEPFWVKATIEVAGLHVGEEALVDPTDEATDMAHINGLLERGFVVKVDK